MSLLGSLLGFKMDGWDYATFLVLFLMIMIGLTFVVWMMGLPGRIAIARNHPDAEAVKVMGYSGFIAVVPWIQAFIWAFKPTDIIDIRRFPEAEAEAIKEDIARLSPPPKKKKTKTQPKDAAGPGHDGPPTEPPKADKSQSEEAV